MKILITGIAGFVGSHLAEYILTEHPNTTVHGTVLPKELRDNIQTIVPALHLHELDITDATGTYRLIEEVRPDIVFHLAAQSYVRTSWESPQATLTTNIVGQANLLEAIRLQKDGAFDPTFVIAGSSEEYGVVPPPLLPIKEDAPLNPLSPYAVSKIGQDFLGYQYFHTYGLKAIRLRTFNHTGPRRPTAFGDSHLAHTIALIERRQAKPQVTYRDLGAVRDFTDVRDIVRAYFLAAQRCQAGEVYNVCSGKGVSIKQIYETLLSLASVRPIAMVPDPAGPRATDGGTIIGNNQRFCQRTGWEPRIDFLTQTLPDILNYWRAQQ